MKYRKANPEKSKNIIIKANAKYKQLNTDKFKLLVNRPKAKYRKLNANKVKESAKKANIKYKQTHPERYKQSQTTWNLKRKMLDPVSSQTDNTVNKGKRFKLNSHASTDIDLAKLIRVFHSNISTGPEYVCTCCNQLWYKSSVTKSNISLYKLCSEEMLNTCLNGIKSVDNNEWICSTCHSNLKVGKVPTCAKANKMTFPENPRP